MESSKIGLHHSISADGLRNGTFSSRRILAKTLDLTLAVLVRNQIFVTKTSEHVPSNLLTLLTLDKIPRRRAAGDVFDIQN